MASELPEKLTLPVILDLFDKLDNGLMELSVDDMKALGKSAREKVDNYKTLMDRCDNEAGYFAELEKQFGAKKRALTNKKDQIKKMMIHFMSESGETDLAGNLWRASLKISEQNKTVPIVKTEPTSAMYIKMKNFIRRSYAWNMAEIKANLKSENPNKVLAELFKLEDSKSINFYPKTEV